MYAVKTDELIFLNGRFQHGSPSTEIHSRRIYEVLRVVDACPLFLEEHLARLEKSVQHASLCSYPGNNKIRQYVIDFLSQCHMINGNFEICLIYSEGNQHDVQIQELPHHYPGEELYRQGVVCQLLFDERENPQIKEQGLAVRQKADKILKDKNIYETVLVNRNGLVTEGSRSNLFLIKGKEIYTAPEKLVLAGITRQKIINTIRSGPYVFKSKAVHYQELQSFDAAFISGTSPKVLAINQIDSFFFDPINPLIRWCAEDYEHILQKDIRKYQQNLKS